MHSSLRTLPLVALLFAGCVSNVIESDEPFAFDEVNSALFLEHAVEDQLVAEWHRGYLLLTDDESFGCSEYQEELESRSFDEVLFDQFRNTNALLIYLERQEVDGWEGSYASNGATWVDGDTLGGRLTGGWMLSGDLLQSVGGVGTWVDIDAYDTSGSVRGSFDFEIVRGAFSADPCGSFDDSMVFPSDEPEEEE